MSVRIMLLFILQGLHLLLAVVPEQHLEQRLGLPCLHRVQTFLLALRRWPNQLLSRLASRPHYADHRRLRLVQQLTQARGQSRAFFIGVAASLGAVATVTEFRPFTCETPCEEPAFDEAWAHAWRLNLPATVVTEHTCEDGTETPLAVWGDTTIECVVRGLSPAHTTVLFAYG